MSSSKVYLRNKAKQQDIITHFQGCKFAPPLESYVNIDLYSKKMLRYAERFECWVNTELAGFAAIYCNDDRKNYSFITNISVMEKYTRQGIAKELLYQVISHCKSLGFREIGLEVHSDNVGAIKIYEKFGFKQVGRSKESNIKMSMQLQGRK